MTIDRCEDSLVYISRLQHVSNDIQVYRYIFRGLRVAQIPMKEGTTLGTWMICTRFEVCVCSYFLKDDNQTRDFSSRYCL